MCVCVCGIDLLTVTFAVCTVYTGDDGYSYEIQANIINKKPVGIDTFPVLFY